MPTFSVLTTSVPTYSGPKPSTTTASHHEDVAGDFAALAGPYRPELMRHCFRLLGSMHEAEDVVQETMLRAWRARGRYENRASLRTWLYTIATNACFTALRRRVRRPLPIGFGKSDAADAGPGDVHPCAPDEDPAIRAVDGAELREALHGAMAVLPRRQWSVLVLRDVLGFRAAEVATLLGASAVAVNSALQRARATLAGSRFVADRPQTATCAPRDRATQETLERYLQAFAVGDVAALVALLTDDGPGAGIRWAA
ncbi:RNA polymerase subunit sigma-70 [Pseudonocardia sp. GCM10023141]|uniref:RNA polymerase subunit sigma-70 n=1 Tax=Pseudonocardia sp. GCM10023141 TaxID=3252653 RepID=UPI00362082FE